jgi:hypothetical protein
MNLKLKSNDELIELLKLQVENERKLLMEILYSLRGVEERKLHLDMGHPNLYEFAMKELGYSSGAAHRRISAMRLLQAGLRPISEKKISPEKIRALKNFRSMKNAKSSLTF